MPSLRRGYSRPRRRRCHPHTWRTVTESFAEEVAADLNHRGALVDGDLEISAHPHRALVEIESINEASKHGEAGASRLRFGEE